MNIASLLATLALVLISASSCLKAQPLQAAIGFDNYAQLKVYGVQQSAPMTIGDAHKLLDNANLEDMPLDTETMAALQRFLVYDALKHYLGFLLHLNPRPEMEYFNRFSSLGERLDGDFLNIQREAVQTAIKISHALRFDVSMIQWTTKEIYNKTEEAGVADKIHSILSRLDNISAKLNQLYPSSHGELPPVLIAYVSSVFIPKTEKERIACVKKFSEGMKSSVMRILATQELNASGELLSNPIIYNITPMGSISSKAN